MTYYCEVCGQIKDCTRREHLYPKRHFEIRCYDCYEKYKEEVQLIRDRQKLEAIYMREKEEVRKYELYV